MSSSNKIEQNKAQYHLDRQTTKISALSSGNVHKYEFLADRKGLARKNCCSEIIWIFSIRKEVKSTN